ncbi:MAG: hypothetical protein AAFP02_13580, partial [Bacteroidota bacterium]
GTASNNTEPTIDHNPGNSQGNYLYLEASNGCNQQEAIMVSPCFDLGSATFPQFSFWYHLYGEDMGELHLDLSIDGANWINDITPFVF